jgi:hypothetical protein
MAIVKPSIPDGDAMCWERVLIPAPMLDVVATSLLA